MAKQNTTLKHKVFVALSGGVDSSVAALLLKNEGYEVTGVFMREFDFADVGNAREYLSCAQTDDRESARAVASHLRIPFEVWDFRREYRDAVVSYLFKGYQRNQTPNPDVMCNKIVKFGAFLKRARSRGADYIATGHYVIKSQIKKSKLKIKDSKHPLGCDSLYEYALRQAKDCTKDQSYFLYTLKQSQLRHCLFPLGQLTKAAVREMARAAGLPNWKRKDSQGICFVGKVPMKDFLKTCIPSTRGALVATNGKRIGIHDGSAYYTIGQRHGIGFGGGDKPYYVVSKDAKCNTVTVGHADDPALYGRMLRCNAINWIAGVEPQLPFACRARIRYRQPLQLCRIKRNGKRIVVMFRTSQRAITSGQAIVFYKRGVMLGGGIISKQL